MFAGTSSGSRQTGNVFQFGLDLTRGQSNTNFTFASPSFNFGRRFLLPTPQTQTFGSGFTSTISSRAFNINVSGSSANATSICQSATRPTTNPSVSDSNENDTVNEEESQNIENDSEHNEEEGLRSEDHEDESESENFVSNHNERNTEISNRSNDQDDPIPLVIDTNLGQVTTATSGTPRISNSVVTPSQGRLNFNVSLTNASTELIPSQMNECTAHISVSAEQSSVSQSTEANEATSQQTELDVQQSSPSLPFGSTENVRLQSMNRDSTILQGTSSNQTTALPDLSHNNDSAIVATSTITAVSVVQNSAESMDNFTATSAATSSSNADSDSRTLLPTCSGTSSGSNCSIMNSISREQLPNTLFDSNAPSATSAENLNSSCQQTSLCSVTAPRTSSAGVLTSTRASVPSVVPIYPPTSSSLETSEENQLTIDFSVDPLATISSGTQMRVSTIFTIPSSREDMWIITANDSNGVITSTPRSNSDRNSTGTTEGIISSNVSSGHGTSVTATTHNCDNILMNNSSEVNTTRPLITSAVTPTRFSVTQGNTSSSSPLAVLSSTTSDSNGFVGGSSISSNLLETAPAPSTSSGQPNRRIRKRSFFSFFSRSS